MRKLEHVRAGAWGREGARTRARVCVCVCVCVSPLRSEAGSWWYANARLAVTVLTVIVWTPTSERVYYTYASHVLDQSTAFALTCVHDALDRHADAAACTKQVIWADCGGHFRSCRFLSDALVASLRSRPVLTQAELNFSRRPWQGPLRCPLREDVAALLVCLCVSVVVMRM